MKSEIHEDPAFSGHFLFPSIGGATIYLVGKPQEEVTKIAETALDDGERFVIDEKSVLAFLRHSTYDRLGSIKQRDGCLTTCWRAGECESGFNQLKEDYSTGKLLGIILPKDWALFTQRVLLAKLEIMDHFVLKDRSGNDTSIELVRIRKTYPVISDAVGELKRFGYEIASPDLYFSFEQHHPRPQGYKGFWINYPDLEGRQPNSKQYFLCRKI